MNKSIVLVPLALALAFALPFAVSAAQLTAGEQPSIPAGALAEDVYVVGGNVTSAATITGDLVAGGGNVLIQGSVSQDAAIGGGSVTVLATIGDDLRVGGGNVTVAGRIGGDLVAGGGQVQLSGEGVSGDVVWGGGVLRIDAPVAGDLQLGGGEVYINAPVAGDITFTGDKLTFGSGARVTGSVTYRSPNEAVIEEGAVVTGDVVYEAAATSSRAKTGAAVAAFLSLAFLVSLLTRFIAALVIGLYFHRYSTELVASAYARPLMHMLVGFAALVALPAASLLLLITVVGIPFGLMGLIAFAALMLFGWVVMPMVLGSLVYSWVSKRGYEVNWKTILTGVLINAVLSLIPFVGWVIQLGFMLLTVGAIARLKASIARDWR